MDWRVPFCSVLFALINVLQVSTGAARLAGVYTKRIATALTLFNTFILVTRMANLLMVPEIGSLADIARSTMNNRTLEWQFRIILGSSTVGCLLATLLIPTFVEIFQRGISGFERTSSLPKLFLGLLNPKRSKLLSALLAFSMVAVGGLMLYASYRGWLNKVHGGSAALILIGLAAALGLYVLLSAISWITHPEIFRKPSWLGITVASFAKIPTDFVILNVFVQAFWTVGWMAAVYAGVLNPARAITCVSLSGIITGVSTILLTVFVDPKAALITDQAAHGIRPIEHIQAVVVFLTLGSVFGTLFAQVLFTPASMIIAWVASHI